MVKIDELNLGTSLDDPTLDYDNHYLPVDDPAAVSTEKYKISDFIPGYSIITGPSVGSSISGVTPNAGDLVLLYLNIGSDQWLFSDASTAKKAEYVVARKVTANTFRILPFGTPIRWVGHPFSDGGEPLGFPDEDYVLYLLNDGTLSGTPTSGTTNRIVKAAKIVDANNLIFMPYSVELEESPITSTGELEGEVTGITNFDFAAAKSRYAFARTIADTTFNLSAIEGGEYNIKLDNTGGHVVAFALGDLGLTAQRYLLKFYYDRIGSTMYHISSIVLF